METIQANAHTSTVDPIVIAQKKKYIAKLKAAQAAVAAEEKEERTMQPTTLGALRRHLDEETRLRKNKGAVERLLETAEAALTALETPTPAPRPPAKKYLPIVSRFGVDADGNPETTVETVRPSADPFRWELKTCHHSWQPLGDPGQVEIRPGPTDNGSVRLVGDDGTTSNVIGIDKTLKQHANKIRKQTHRFTNEDPIFASKCAVVADRIRSFLQGQFLPGRFELTGRSLSTRIFEDRVLQLPQRLGRTTDEVIALCDASPADDDYCRMVEFVDPTIRLDPDGMRRKMRYVKSGQSLVLKLSDEAGRAAARAADARRVAVARRAAAERRVQQALERQRRQQALAARRQREAAQRQLEADRRYAEEQRRRRQVEAAQKEEKEFDPDEDQPQGAVFEDDNSDFADGRSVYASSSEDEDDAQAAAEQAAADAAVARLQAARADAEKAERERREAAEQAEREAEEQAAADAAVARLQAARADAEQAERERREAEERAEREAEEQAEREAEEQAAREAAEKAAAERQAAELRQSSEETDDGDDGDDDNFEDANSAAAAAPAAAAASETPLETWQRFDPGADGELDRATFNEALEAQGFPEMPGGNRKTFFDTEFYDILSGKKKPEDLTNIESTVDVESAPEPEEDEGDGDASGPQSADAGQSEADADLAILAGNPTITQLREINTRRRLGIKTAGPGRNKQTVSEDIRAALERAPAQQSAAVGVRRSKRLAGRRLVDESPAVALSGAQPNWEYSTEDEAVEDESLTIRDQSSDMEFAESSAVETDSDVEEPVPMLASVPETSAPSSEMEFAESSTAPSSEMEFAESSAASAPTSEMEFAESSAASAPSSELDFAESSAMDTDSEMEFAASSAVSTSGMDFAESSAVDTDSAKEDISEK